MALLRRDGVKIYYEVHGDGPPMLLTHAFSSSSHMWAGQRDAFGEYFKLITWDMRGHGRSDYPSDEAEYSREATLGDMAALLDHVGAASAILGGLSMGGFMSLAFRLAYPKRVRALVICDTGPGFRSDGPRQAWNEMAVTIAQRFEEEGLARLAKGGPETRTAPHRDASGLVHAARAMMPQTDASVIDSLPEIDVPTLIVVGADDKPFLGPADYMAAKIPGAKTAVIAGAGHAANMDQPAAFNKEVLDFLRNAGLMQPG